MAKQVMMNGIAHVARREDIHVKRGEYTHGDVKGWNLYEADTGRLVISSDPGRPRSSYEFQQAKYPTFADLMDAVHDLEDHLKSLAARRRESANLTTQGGTMKIEKMNGYQLMTAEQQREMDDLTERATHRDTMQFTALDASNLAEYEALCERLEREYQHEYDTNGPSPG